MKFHSYSLFRSLEDSFLTPPGSMPLFISSFLLYIHIIIHLLYILLYKKTDYKWLNYTFRKNKAQFQIYDPPL